jgi:DNA recombination protein RmuC
MGETVLTIGTYGVSVGEALVAAAGLILAGLVAIALVLMRAARRAGVAAVQNAMRAEELEQRMAELSRIQADTAGRLHAVGDMLAGRQAELARAVGERLDSVSHRIGQSMATSAQQTVESLRHLHERIAVIDHAQKNIAELTTHVTTLRDVLANKQARGAFGQGRMEAIVEDGLPRGRSNSSSRSRTASGRTARCSCPTTRARS